MEPRRISSRQEYWFRTAVLPVILCGNTVLMATWSFTGGHPAKDYIAALAICVGAIFMSQLRWEHLATDVWDCGDHLLFRHGRVEERVPFSSIVSLRTWRQTIFVTFERDGTRDTRIFMAQFRLPLRQRTVIDELAEKCRSQRLVA